MSDIKELQTDLDSIRNRVLGAIPDKFDKRQGSVIDYAVAPAILEFAQAYELAEWLSRQSFASTSDYEHLKLLGLEHDLRPKPASKAIVKGKFSMEIDIGTTFIKTKANSLEYEVKSFMSKDSEFYYYQLECLTAGTQGNNITGDIIPTNYIEGLKVAELVEVLILAENMEDIEHFRERVLTSDNAKEFAGNMIAYINRVTAMNGVGQCRVKRAIKGAGSVGILIVDTELRKATKTLIDKVQKDIDPVPFNGQGVGFAPIGAIVYVDTIEEEKINISFKLTLDTGYNYEMVKEQIETALSEYIQSVNKDWGSWSPDNNDYPELIVRLSRVDNAILNIEGIVDIADTKINGIRNNLTVTGDNVGVLGVVENEN